VVNSQERLLQHIGVQGLIAVIGGSLGGVCAMEYALRYPQKVRGVITIAAGPKATTLHKLHNFEQVFAIEEDRNFNYGNYYDGDVPRMGLMLARIIAHKSFVHLDVMEERARGEIVQQADDLKGLQAAAPDRELHAAPGEALCAALRREQLPAYFKHVAGV